MEGKRDSKIIQRIDELTFPHGWVIFFCLFVLIDIIMFQIDNVHYNLIVTGETPCVGGSGAILFILASYVCLGLLYIVIKFSLSVEGNLKLVCQFSVKILLVLLPLLPLVGIFAYCDFYSRYSDNLERKYIEQSHKCVGVVYSKESPGYRSHHYTFRTGVDSNHTREQRISEDSPLIKCIHVGDTIILRVSDEYPRVNRVLNWQPTPEEIEKYKTPVRLIEKNR